ncbi:hypothetical protein SLEP1_g38579 [Rubroshorea leprosula]|nr:hypothetical protein SLEP1_g38579 [Rubroshorea leprosula]
MTSFERIVTHPATAMVAKEVIEQPNVNLESLKQVILNLFNAPTTLSTASGTKPWYFDSGCCNHMSSITAYFSSVSPNNSFPNIYSADGSRMSVSHIGNVYTKSLTLPNALLVPKLSYNLLSVGQLCDFGLEVTFSAHGCRVQDPRTRQLLGIGRKGTLPQQSCPYTSKQNGRAEHKHRHILDSVRALFISSSCPERFWGEAALTAVYLINHIPSSVLNNQSPYERLYGILPTYNLLKVFGCACFVLLPPHEHNKLEPRARLCCFLGYGITQKGYRCTAEELYNASPHAPTSSVEDDLPAGIALYNFEPSSTSSSVSPVDSTNELIFPSSGHPTRVRNPPNYLRDYHCFHAITSLHEPQSYQEASFNPLWQQAMQDELQALENTHTWDLVDLSAEKSLIGCKWVYKIKTRSDGSVERYKACLVAKGFTQEYGINYEEKFAPVAHLTSVRSLLAIAAMQRWKLFQMDVKNAFLTGDLEEEVYIKQLPGLNHPSNKTARGMVLLLFYVDDMIITGDDVAVTSSSDGYMLSQVKYASDLVSKAELNDGKSVSTPLEPNVKLTPMDGSSLFDPTRYQQLFMATPRSTHYATVLCIIRYVKGTLFHGLYFSANSSLMLRAYSDADWAGDPSDHKSTIGYCLFLGNSLISWRWLLEDMGIPQSSSTDLYCDNQSAMQIAHNDVFYERTKHIEVDCHFIRHHVAQGTVHLVFIGSADQPANLFTKAHFPGLSLRYSCILTLKDSKYSIWQRERWMSRNIQDGDDPLGFLQASQRIILLMTLMPTMCFLSLPKTTRLICKSRHIRTIGLTSHAFYVFRSFHVFRKKAENELGIDGGVATAAFTLFYTHKQREEGWKIHWVGWDKVCRDKKNGGLGVPNLRKRNLSLLEFGGVGGDQELAIWTCGVMESGNGIQVGGEACSGGSRRRRGVQVDGGCNRCLRCRPEAEDVDHVIFGCGYAYQVWMRCLEWWEFHAAMPR